MMADQQIDYDFHEAGKSGKLSERLFHKARVKSVINAIEYKGKILDVGCGTGSILLNLPWECKITGIDLSPYAIKKARDYCSEQYRSAVFLVGDGNALPFKDNLFDTVLLIDVLEHTENPKQIVSEIKRVLKPRGKVVVTVPNERHPVVKFEFLRKLFSNRPDIHEHLDEPYNINKLKAVFEGFELLESKTCAYWIEILSVFVYKGEN